MHGTSFIFIFNMMPTKGKLKCCVWKENWIKMFDNDFLIWDFVLLFVGLLYLLWIYFQWYTPTGKNISIFRNWYCGLIVLESWAPSQRGSSTLFAYLRFEQPTWSVGLWFWASKTESIFWVNFLIGRFAQSKGLHRAWNPALKRLHTHQWML